MKCCHNKTGCQAGWRHAWFWLISFHVIVFSTQQVCMSAFQLMLQDLVSRRVLGQLQTSTACCHSLQSIPNVCAPSNLHGIIFHAFYIAFNRVTHDTSVACFTLQHDNEQCSLISGKQAQSCLKVLSVQHNGQWLSNCWHWLNGFTVAHQTKKLIVDTVNFTVNNSNCYWNAAYYKRCSLQTCNYCELPCSSLMVQYNDAHASLLQNTLLQKCQSIKHIVQNLKKRGWCSVSQPFQQHLNPRIYRELYGKAITTEDSVLAHETWLLRWVRLV